jgi:2-hydroxycyclohexanecarboxyl-CoA dehydrogenase
VAERQRVALVTGGTAGVGLVVARTLAQRGLAVTVTGRSAESGRAALETLSEVSPHVAFVAGDAADADDNQAVCHAVAERFGEGIDVLVSAGAEGLVGPRPFAEMTAADVRASFDTRIYPRIMPVHAALPALRIRGGSVVLLTTDAARHPTPGESVVGAAGAAVVLLVKALARELARDAVRVNGVAMTITSGTPSWDRIFAGESFQSHLFERAVSRFPSGHPPNVDDVARVVAFLADEAGEVTGQTLSVNGGLSFGGW